MTDRGGRAAAVLAVAVTFLVAGGYVVAQQKVRHDADHPQMEMARAAVANLNAGAVLSSVVPNTRVDLGQSASPYLIVVDAEGAVMASSGTLNGASVTPPSGVFDYVRAHGEDTVTWQPAPYARSAIVVDRFDRGFVIAGRSLAATQTLEQELLRAAIAAWCVAIVAIGAFVLLRFRH